MKKDAMNYKNYTMRYLRAAASVGSDDYDKKEVRDAVNKLTGLLVVNGKFTN